MNALEWFTSDFGGYLNFYVQSTPVDFGYQQYLATVALRKQFGSTASAISSDEFVESMHATLRGFFRLVRAVKMLPPDLFKAEIRRHTTSISAFDGMTIDAETGEAHDDLWRLVSTLKVAECKSRVVSGSKTLHLLLPDLVVPIEHRCVSVSVQRGT